MEEQRLIEIESKLAYQEDLLADLNAALTDQQAQITELERLCRTLRERVRSIAGTLRPEGPDDGKPPHY